MSKNYYDPHSSNEVFDAKTAYMRQKMEYTNLYCRRQRADRDALTPTAVLQARAEVAWNSNYRGGREKKRTVNGNAKGALLEYMKHRSSGVS